MKPSKKLNQSEYATYAEYLEAFVRDCVEKEVRKALIQLGNVKAVSTDITSEEVND